MEELNDLLYDDVEAKYLSLQNKKKKRKKKRRRKRLTTLFTVIILLVLYFMSDFSKVKYLEVKGNRFYSEEKILSIADLSYESRYAVLPKIYLKWKLKKDQLIESVEIHKTWDGAITIDVKEKTIVGYYIEDGKNYALIDDGTSKEITSSDLSIIVDYPLIDGFSKEERINLAKSFSQEEEVDETIIHMISEMVPYETSYDEHMVKIVMQDGNTIFTSYESMPLLNDYLATLKSLKKKNVCLWPDVATHSIHNESCSKKE